MAEGTDMVNVSSEESSESGQDEVEMATAGINMFLNNGLDEAQALFNKYKDESPLMHAGYSFVSFVQALMSFEEEKLAEALKILQLTEKKCETGDSFMGSLRKKFSKRKKDKSVEDRLQRQIIIADSLMFQAILIFTNQDLTSYIKGGWYLRRAWKLYEKLHAEIVSLQEKKTIEKIAQMSQQMANCGDIGTVKQQDSIVQDGTTDTSDNELTEEVISRLLGSVNFGYGTFQLCMSLVPPKILKLIEFLGFEADRDVGIAALMHCSLSQDMKAPLAVLSLLWYHTVMRPFFALDGIHKFAAGISDAEDIIKQKEETFPNSSLFLFFHGRIHRLKKENDASLATYNKALEESGGQREIKIMCLYEIGWCNLLKLKWDTCLEIFSKLLTESRWSKAYYTYLVAICHGAMGELDRCHEILKQVPSLVRRKNNQIEAFVNRRADKFKKSPPSQEHSRLLALELLFLWHALPTCSEELLRPMMEVCDVQKEPKVFHLKCLIEGGIYRELGEEEMAITCLKEAVARHQGMKEDFHVPAFAMFELSNIYMKYPDKHAEAKTLLLKIKDNFKDYDFENRLTVRINSALSNLKKNAKQKS